MDWRSLSEITTGMVIANRIPIQAVRSETMYPPYDEIITKLKSGKTLADIIISNSVDAVQSAIAAEENINGTGNKVDWINQLEQAYTLYQDAENLTRLIKKMKQNDQEAGLQARELVNKTASLSVGNNFRKLSDIEPAETPYIETGWKIWDEHLVGVPAVGMVLVGGLPGSGKTEFAKTLATAFAKRYDDRIVAAFSVEMMGEEFAGRFKVKGCEKQDWHDRIWIDDQAFMTPEMIVSRSATIENLGMIIIDFADLITGGGDENKYSGMYIYLMQAAKQLKCPIVVLAQFSRTYQGGIPRPQNFRYTALAEALGWSLYTLYNPNSDYFADSEDREILPPVPGYAYICCWKQRGGFKKHPNDSPGAICLPFRGGAGWHPTKGSWVYIQKQSKKKG